MYRNCFAQIKKMLHAAHRKRSRMVFAFFLPLRNENFTLS